MSYLDLASGARLHYQHIAGNPGKPWLIFLHEGLGSIAQWKKFPEALCAMSGCPGLVYDRAGYGDSSPQHQPRTIHYLHHAALSELPELIDALIPDSPYILFGHSDGGSIALINAAERSPQLCAVVTVAAHVTVEQEAVTGIETAQRAYDTGKLTGLEKYHGDKTDMVFRAWSDTWRAPWFAHWNIEYLLPSIIAPVLAVQGIDDQYGTENQVDFIVSQCGGISEKKALADCAHSPHLEAQAQLIETVCAFLVRV